VALRTVFGVPESSPVAGLKDIPAGVALIAKLAIVPPVSEATVNPVADVFTVTVSAIAERVNAGAASTGAAGAVMAAGAGGTYALVVTAWDVTDTGEVPSAFVAVTVKL